MFETVLDKALRSQLSRGNLRVGYPSGRTGHYGNGAGPELAARIADSGALRAIVLDPGLGVPEMYMDGRLILETGDLHDFINTLRARMRSERATPAAKLNDLRRRVTRSAAWRAITPSRARANVAHHYDLDQRLYRLFLDEDMQYSCAWFETPELTLDQAQLAKKRLIAAKLLLRPGARVLDIGSGWGGMALYLAQVCGVDVTGITLSAEQLRVASARAEALGLGDRVRFRLQDYRQVDERFDAIVSVGMLEHVGLRHIPEYFATAARLLDPDGVMLVHSMALPTRTPYNHPFVEKFIFPGGYLPTLSDVTPAVEGARLLMRDIEILSLHYADTTREWRRRFHAAREEVLALTDARFFRMWDFYLAGSESVFRVDALHVFHLQLAHRQDRIPRTRDYIAETMAALRRCEAGIPAYAHLHADSRILPHSVAS